MNLFTLPVRVMIGDVIEQLSDITRKRLLIICDRFLVDTPNLKAIVSSLSANNHVDIFSDVTPDPSVQDVAAAIHTLATVRPDTLIAYGGGSAIDLAKAVKYFAQQSGLGTCSFIAIPTTSGTGSEVTSATVISIPELNKKIPLFHEALLPDRAILDANLTLTVPPQVTLFTGLDVLTHAIEAMVSINACHFSDALAEKAASLVFTWLSTAVHEPGNLDARHGLHTAASLAGIAFNHAGLGLTHAIAHQLGAFFHLPHGQANALALIPVIRFNRQSVKARNGYARLARSLGLTGCKSAEQHGVDLLISAIEGLFRQLSYSPELLATGKNDCIHVMAEAVLSDVTLRTNPVQPDQQMVESIIRAL